MKIHGHFICWNEERIIPYFLRHYLPICEKIFIYDNCSMDKSCQLFMEKYPKVEVITFITDDKQSESYQTKLKSKCWEKSRGECDWVIIGDMDEFVYHPNLTGRLTKLTEQNIDVVQLTAYDMVSLNYPTTKGQIYEEVNRGARNSFYDKCQLFNPNKVRLMNYAPGCHAAQIHTPGFIQKCSDIYLLHFKHLGVKATYDRYQILNARRNQEMIDNRWGIQYEQTQEQVQGTIEDIWTRSIPLI